MQGDLRRVAGRAALGGGILVLPLLFVIARDLDFATLGPFADAWWVTLVLAIVGLTFAMDALIRAATLLRRVSQALDRGYDVGTVVNVLADSGRDTGFLLVGARHFSVCDAREREAIALIRVFSASLYAMAGMWLLIGLAVGLLLGARGVVSPSGLWMGTLLPSLAMYLFAGVAVTVEESRVSRARERWHQQPWAEDLASDEARTWRADFAEREAVQAGPAPHPWLAPTLRRSAILVGALAALVALPILTLVPTSAIGPILTALAVPGYDTVRRRAAMAEALRSYTVGVESGITPAESGQLLHDITYVGSDREPSPGERGPSRRIAQPWLPETGGTNPTGVEPYAWADSLISVVAGGVTDEQRAYLAEVAGHPARADFSRLARAGAIDIASARFVDPFPEGMTLSAMPIPSVGELRTGANAHIGAAAFELVSGRPAPAEEIVREVISIGFLVADAGPTLLDNVIGLALVEAGARALEDLYDVTGQTAKSSELTRLRAAADRAASRARFEYSEGVEAWVRSLPSVVTDTSAVRGLRWESFVAVMTLTPCINLHRMVFGPDQEYQDFIEGARESLVLWPSEEGLFALAKAGWLGTADDAAVTWLGRLLGVSMRRGESACGEVVRRMEARALF